MSYIDVPIKRTEYEIVLYRASDVRAGDVVALAWKSAWDEVEEVHVFDDGISLIFTGPMSDHYQEYDLVQVQRAIEDVR